MPLVCRICNCAVTEDDNEGSGLAPLCGRCVAGRCERCKMPLAKTDSPLMLDGLLFCVNCADEAEDCPTCRGTGEGLYDGARCPWCSGRGCLGTPRQMAAQQGYEP